MPKQHCADPVLLGATAAAWRTDHLRIAAGGDEQAVPPSRRRRPQPERHGLMGHANVSIPPASTSTGPTRARAGPSPTGSRECHV